MYPRVTIDTKKLEHNTKIIADACAGHGIEIMGVTKSFCAVPGAAEAMIRGGVKFLADSRVKNLMKVKDLDVKKVLLRLPMKSQAEDVVKYADISLNSEIETIEVLGQEAIKQGKTHNIVLMTDLGDLREGFLPKDVDSAVEKILKIEGIKLYGLGVNLTCYGGVVPDDKNLGQLCDIAGHIEKKFDVKLEMITGGNSSSFYLLDKGTMPDKVNNLRMGEIIVLGRETAYGDAIEGTYDDAFKLQAEIVEVKTKGSVPIGEIGMDAFGNTPTFEDKGMIVRAIAAVGRQDVDPDNLTPLDEGIEILGSSSDHLLMNISASKMDYKVGDIVEFKLDYGSLLSLTTSEYIEKVCE
ncbi:ornithine racemase Orr [Fusibacter sp. JL216-2]|uniref:ornithine racemase Orr n=1 Tax=Fusibacter sp. JL216-2 TaxID=3071453 RepID=UPI003D333561